VESMLHSLRQGRASDRFPPPLGEVEYYLWWRPSDIMASLIREAIRKSI
jgi:hypothetical protein